MSQQFGSPQDSDTKETATSIKAKYESNTDTNAFTDNDVQALESLALGNIKNQNNGQDVKVWAGTQAQYDAVSVKDMNSLYFIVQN